MHVLTIRFLSPQLIASSTVTKTEYLCVPPNQLILSSTLVRKIISTNEHAVRICLYLPSQTHGRIFTAYIHAYMHSSPPRAPKINERTCLFNVITAAAARPLPDSSSLPRHCELTKVPFAREDVRPFGKLQVDLLLRISKVHAVCARGEGGQARIEQGSEVGVAEVTALSATDVLGIAYYQSA